MLCCAVTSAVKSVVLCHAEAVPTGTSLSAMTARGLFSNRSRGHLLASAIVGLGLHYALSDELVGRLVCMHSHQ